MNWHRLTSSSMRFVAERERSRTRKLVMASPSNSSRVSGKSGRTPALSFIFVTLVLIILGFGIVIPVLPQIVREFEGGSDSTAARSYGWLVGVFAVM